MFPQLKVFWHSGGVCSGDITSLLAAGCPPVSERRPSSPCMAQLALHELEVCLGLAGVVWMLVLISYTVSIAYEVICERLPAEASPGLGSSTGQRHAFSEEIIVFRTVVGSGEDIGSFSFLWGLAN